MNVSLFLRNLWDQVSTTKQIEVNEIDVSSLYKLNKGLYLVTNLPSDLIFEDRRGSFYFLFVCKMYTNIWNH